MVTVKVNTISTSTGDNIAMQVPLNLKNLSSAPATVDSSAGDIYYNTTTNKVQFYNGTAWADL
jgi:hypothetical protein